MSFHSILYEKPANRPEWVSEIPPFFEDLNLDQVINTVTLGKNDYDLKPFFYTSLRDMDTIHYRQAIAREIEEKALLEMLNAFAARMSTMRRYLTMIQKLYYQNHKHGWFLEAVLTYGDAVRGLERDLSAVDLESRGWSSFYSYLHHYIGSEPFLKPLAEAERIKQELAAIQYCVIIKESLVKVRKYEDEIDYSVEVQNTFERFKQGAVKDYRVKLGTGSGMNHVEAAILDLVARLYPEVFKRLDRFCEQHGNFIDDVLNTFDREIQFYISYLEHCHYLRKDGLGFCYSQLSKTSKEIEVSAGFDLALAHKCRQDSAPVVDNDVFLKDAERVIVVSGPNQGGKTTFARMLGQLHFLASLGLPVPAKKSQLFLCDRIFTHFEKEEDIRNLRGKLQDDMVRIYEILAQASSDSLIILNEIFTSTTLKDAVFLSHKIMERISGLDLLCVWVTFIDEMASFNAKTISMVSTVVPDNPAMRTYKIVRKPADGLAYAISIAEKYHLTYERIKERIQS